MERRMAASFLHSVGGSDEVKIKVPEAWPAWGEVAAWEGGKGWKGLSLQERGRAEVAERQACLAEHSESLGNRAVGTCSEGESTLTVAALAAALHPA